LRNEDNKLALYALVAQALISTISPNETTIVVTLRDEVVSNQVLDVSEIAPCDHEEVDTRMLLHVKQAKCSAIIKTVDTDVVVIAVSCFHDLDIERVWIEFGTNQNKRFIAIHDIVSALPQSEKVCSSLPIFYAITGCDSVSSLLV